MIETEEQRRWWFATHTEYSWSRAGQNRQRLRDKEVEAKKAQAKEIDEYVDEQLKYETNPTTIVVLETLKEVFGTESLPKEPSVHPAADRKAYQKYEDVLDRIAGASNKTRSANDIDKRTHLIYQNGYLVVRDRNGKMVMAMPATSGNPGVRDPKVPKRGPIPPGKYTFYPEEISQAGFFRKYIDPRDWGEYRVTLYPDKNTNTYGRKDFFLHGGKEPSSAGCIDLGEADKRLFPLLRRLKGPISIEVK